MRSRSAFALTLAAACMGSFASNSHAQDKPAAASYLTEGKLAEGDRALEASLKDRPDDDQARFGLGMIRFVASVEHLVQRFQEHGFDDASMIGSAIPIARLPVPSNPDPKPTSYEDLRSILQQFLDDLARAESTLSSIQDDSVKLTVPFARIRLDLDRSGQADAEETLWSLYTKINPPRQADGRPASTSPPADGLPVSFDRGDVAWLRGYCHLLSAMVEAYMALDGKTLFEHSGHLFFKKAITPYPFLKRGEKGKMDYNQIDDLIAFVHLQSYPIKDPARLVAALDHLKAMTRLSRESWASYLAETDDDHEWVPSPRQKPSLPWARPVTAEMVKGWQDFLEEADKLLDGKILVPFWRDAGGKGVNLRRAFTEPREVDAILWLQGTAAIPYLEEGPVSQKGTWERFMRVFNGEFIGYAFWFN